MMTGDGEFPVWYHGIMTYRWNLFRLSNNLPTRSGTNIGVVSIVIIYGTDH